MKRLVHPDVQAAARALIATDGLAPAAAAIGLSPFLLAKAAAGARLTEFAAEALERRLATNRSSAVIPRGS